MQRLKVFSRNLDLEDFRRPYPEVYRVQLATAYYGLHARTLHPFCGSPGVLQLTATVLQPGWYGRVRSGQTVAAIIVKLLQNG